LIAAPSAGESGSTDSVIISSVAVARPALPGIFALSPSSGKAELVRRICSAPAHTATADVPPAVVARVREIIGIAR
jgi:hypothetical protein